MRNQGPWALGSRPQAGLQRGSRMSSPAGEISYRFRSYRPGKTLAPVTIVTPQDDASQLHAGGFVHTFFDVCPFSPSQRFLAVTRIPYGDRVPVLGDLADVCVIDLERETLRRVYTTAAWELQLGANVQWGRTDRFLYSNDIIDGQGAGVRIDLDSGETRALAGPLYHIDSAETNIIGFPLDLLNATQRGYGIPEPPDVERRPLTCASDVEGLWRTMLEPNEKTLLVSIGDIVRATHDVIPEHTITYLFHSKYNRDGSRIMQVVRSIDQRHPRRKFGRMLVTFRADGSAITCAIAEDFWGGGGNHPNWHPDGAHLVMNLKPDGQMTRFCQFLHDGADFKVLSERHAGGGHPSLNGEATFLLTDAYRGEARALPGFETWPSDEVPIRLLDLRSDEEAHVCTINTLGVSGRFRLDPHPAWSRDSSMICFNGAPEGARAVLIADLRSCTRG